MSLVENNSRNQLQSSINEYGQVLTEIKSICYSKCANLLDTHEVTLAEKSCSSNCFKKLNFAYNNFNRLTNEEFTKLSTLKVLV